MQTGHEAGRAAAPRAKRLQQERRPAGFRREPDSGSFVKPLVRRCGERRRSEEDLAVTSREPDAELLF